MNIGDMRIEVFRIADQMLPKSALPDVALAFAANRFFICIEPPGEAGFQQANAGCKIVIALRQAPDKMRMFVQNNGRDGFKRMALGYVRP